MTDTDWHAPPALLAQFARDPGAVDDMTASSIEAHVVACGDCREQLTVASDPMLAAASWERIADRIDRPRPTVLERLLQRAGFGSGFARLVAATPALQAAGLIAMALVAVTAALLSQHADADGVFMVLAPLAPLVAVAASFAPAAEPAGEAAVATPMHGAGLVVRRAVAVLTISVGVLGVAALALPDLDAGAAAWVLPALALSLGALALGTWFRVEAAVAVLAAGWLLSVVSVWWFAGHDVPVADTPTFAAAGQFSALAVAVAAAAVLSVRRDRFATLEAF